MQKFFKRLLIFGLLSSLLILLSIISILWTYSNKLPDYKYLKNYKPPVSSKLYSGNGVLVSDFSSEKRIFVPFGAIPLKVINSFLSSEDKNFFRHPGVDAKGVIRAIKNNIYNIRLIAPTTSKERIKRISNSSRGFLYYVSIMGITGTKKPSINSVKKSVNSIKKITSLPILIGL